MYFMFWVWLVVIIATAITEFCTLEVVSIWFTLAAIIPFILSATVPAAVGWELEILIFVVLSAVMLISLRGVTRRYLLRNANEKTNVDALVGRKLRMLSRTDFETLGSARVNDVTWSVLGLNQQTIEKDTIVEVVKVAGNRLIVKPCKDEETQAFGAHETVETKEEVADTAKSAKLAKAVKSAGKGTETVAKTEKTSTEKDEKNKVNDQSNESDKNKTNDKNEENAKNAKNAKNDKNNKNEKNAKNEKSKENEKSLKKDEKTVKNTKKTAKNEKKTEKSTKKSSKK